MIIDNSYFLSRPVFIPAAQTSILEIGTGLQPDASKLKDFIDEKEYELLLSFLGYDQTKELLLQFNSDGTFKEDGLQKWKYLVDGKEEWKGLRFSYGQRKTSLIAYYIYFYFLAEDNTTYSTVGVQKPDSANSEWKNCNDAQVKVWDLFLRMYGGNYCYGNTPTFFNNWNGTGIMWRGNNSDANNITLYEFLSKNNETYDLTKFRQFFPVNAYNL